MLQMDTSQIIRELGGPAHLAKRLGIRPQAISLWVAKKRIPAERVPALERVAVEVGSSIRAESMRPDVDWAALRR